MCPLTDPPNTMEVLAYIAVPCIHLSSYLFKEPLYWVNSSTVVNTVFQGTNTFLAILAF